MSSYYAVIFTSIQKEDISGYGSMAKRMEELARQQPGFLDLEHAREEVGITISYWKDIQSIKNWKENAEHQFAQIKGRSEWYKYYKIRICHVEREYEFGEI